MSDGAQGKVRTGRLARAGRLGRMAAGIAGGAALAAGRLATAGVAGAEAELHRRTAKSLRKALSELKGLPMKLGQMLSYVDDAVPAEYRAIYRETLRDLQAHVRPVAFAAMRTVMTEELGRAPELVFDDLDPVPIAAASIGQVYRARLRQGDGEPVRVAVKVQYPGIADAVDSDLRNMTGLVQTLGRVLPRFEIEQTLADVTSRLREECDYVRELEHQRAFAHLWAGRDDVLVPRVFESVSSRRVLVSELVDGEDFHAFRARATQAERDRAGRILYEFAFRSLYQHGIFNADPHPGNYLFCADGRVAFLDFGCVQRFSRETIVSLARVRQQLTAGVRGAPLRAAVAELFALAGQVDDQVWEIAERFLVESFRPLWAPQPYRHARAHTEALTRDMVRAKVLFARQVLRTGVTEPKAPGVVFLSRINFGLMSILADLEAEGAFREIMEAIDRDAGLA